MGTVQEVIEKFNTADNEIKATYPKVDPRLVVGLIFDHNAKKENIYTLEILLKPGQDTEKIRESVMYKSGVAPGFYLNGTKMILSHPLNLEFLKWINDQDGIVDVKGAPYSAGGAQLDMWHANFEGVYSGVQEQGTAGKDFLRGYQLTDDNGTAQFTTVYPGWYEGRAIHMHVKVRTFNGTENTFQWTSQFYLPDSVTQQVHTQPPYSTHGQPDMTNTEDGIFTGASTDGLVQNNTGERLMLDIAGDNEQGYTGTFNIVVEMG